MKRNEPEGRFSGFEHINTYYDGMHGCYAAKILPGEYYVTSADECVVTVLGSCVSACVRDKVFGIGGMNHFMLPVTHSDTPRWGNSTVNVATRYGDYAMEHLMNDIISHGGLKKNFEVKLFGGGLINQGQSDIGGKNIKFVRQFLKDEGISVAAEDLGGIHPRKVYYFPQTGKVMMKRINTLHNNTIQKREEKYQHDLDADSISGDIELFD